MQRASTSELPTLAMRRGLGNKRSSMGLRPVGVPPTPPAAAAAAATGGAVGFLDFVDEEDIKEVERAKREEEEWIAESAKGITKNQTLLENASLCMESNQDTWEYYTAALLILFAAEGAVDTLIRFWIDAEVGLTKNQATLFRQDSLRIRGLQEYLTMQLREWFLVHVYRPTLRKVVTGGVRHPKHVESLALDVLKACNSNIGSIPAGARSLLRRLALAVSTRFPLLKAESNLYACVFLFLHWLTPAVVAPYKLGFVAQELQERETVFMLARVGKQLQSWVNGALFPDAASQNSIGSSTDEGLDTAPRVLLLGEQEVVKFVDAMFKQDDGPVRATEAVAPEKVADARLVLTGVLKRHYKFFRELEGALNRQDVVRRHLGGAASHSALFAQVTTDLQHSARTFAVNAEELMAPASKAESHVSAFFSDLSPAQGASSEINIRGRRFVLVNAAAFSSTLAGMRSVTEGGAPHLFSCLHAVLWHSVGVASCRSMMREFGPSVPWQETVLALFPYLAFCGRGRATVGSATSLSKASFLLTARVENSFEAGAGNGGDKKGGGGDVRCQCLAGFMGGWCTLATGGKDLAAVEVTCQGRGDKACFFVVAPAAKLEEQARKVAADMKVSLTPRTLVLIEAACDGLVAAADVARPELGGRQESTGSLSSLMTAITPDRVRARGRTLGRKSVSEGKAALPLNDISHLVRQALAREASSKPSRLDAGRLRSSSNKGRKPSKEGTPTSSAAAAAAAGGAAAAASQQEPPSFQPAFSADSGEIRIMDARYVLFEGSDLSVSFARAAQQALADAGGNGICPSCGAQNDASYRVCSGCGAARHRKALPDAMAVVDESSANALAANKLAYALTYFYGLAAGESLAEHALGSLGEALPSVDLMCLSVSQLGWGDIRVSKLSQLSEGDFWMHLKVDNSFEADGRLGLTLDPLGSPTCSAMAGMIAGWASRVQGVRCACVEVECVGAGSSAHGSCSFICATPSALLEKIKLWLAITEQEESLHVLCGGLGPEIAAGDVLEESPLSARKK